MAGQNEPGSDKTKDQPKEQAKLTVKDIDAFTVEVSCPNNRNLMFWPAGRPLRGRWSMHNMPVGSYSEKGMNKMPDLPGIHIEVNPRHSRVKVLDPLSFEENRELLATAQKVHQEVFSTKPEPDADAVMEGVDDDSLATWVYHCYRGLLENNMRLVKGSAPTIDKIRQLKNLVKMDFAGSFSDSEAYREASTL